ncbi:MAG: HAMP domain-containing histidine kinase [Desulfobacula sp.]|nr:HAMP domain-containing histidine kinase [Desulfobacula sp.]
MQAAPKLRRHITISLWMLTLLMIVVYSILVLYSLFTGMDELTSYDFHLTARDFAVEYRENPDTKLPESRRLKAYLGEKNLPDWFKNNYPLKTLEHTKVEWYEVAAKQFDQDEAFYFHVFPYDLHDGNRLYLLETYTDKDDIPEAFRKSENSGIITIAMGIGFIILVLVAIKGLFKKISSPLDALSGWANNLTREKLEQPHPDFHFEEINQLADLIQNAVQDLNQALNREHQFLRFSSHELRTPIAVLRSNMDLLERLRPDPGDEEKISYQRIRRAMDNMHRMTETLLWLSRKEKNMPMAEPVDIGALVDELVRENRYLLSGKKVVCDLKVIPVRITIPQAAARIVIGNLVRNAFQYTVQGKVDIQVTQEAFIVENTGQTLEQAIQKKGDYGFGLGLMLVEQITRKLNLRYENLPVPDGHRAVVSLHGC